jgi:toxin FitB
VILVDTNVWSEASKPNGAHKIVQWIADNRQQLWLSTIVIAEIRAGIENPDAAEKRDAIENWLALLEKAHESRTLSFDQPSAYALGKLLVLKPQDKKMLDTLLAAQALAHDCPIATRNMKDFEWTGVRVLNPWGA